MEQKKAGPVETRPGYVFITWENCNPNLIKLFRLIGDGDGEAWIFLPGSNEITIEIIANMHVVFKHANIIKHQIFYCVSECIKKSMTFSLYKKPFIPNAFFIVFHAWFLHKHYHGSPIIKGVLNQILIPHLHEVFRLFHSCIISTGSISKFLSYR